MATDFVQGRDLGDWLKKELRRSRRLTIASPFVTRSGLAPIFAEMERRRRPIEITLLTRLDVPAVLTGALDLEALSSLLAAQDDSCAVSLFHVPGLHAKVYALDDREAVVGSGNMTQAGTTGLNVELGIRIAGRSDMRDLHLQLAEWQQFGRKLAREDIEAFTRAVEPYRRTFAWVTQLDPSRLQVFPDESGDYHPVMLRLLKLASGRKGCARAEMLKALHTTERAKEGSGTPEARLLFLTFLGLVKEDGGRIHLTDRGRSTARNKRAFAELLRRDVPDIAAVWGVFEARHPEPLGYEEVRSDLSARPAGAAAKSDEACRWLRSLGVIERKRSEGSGSRRFRYRLARGWAPSAGHSG